MVPAERVADHPRLGHEHVRAVERAEAQGERPGDIEERRQQPDVTRQQLAGRDVCPRVDRVARRRELNGKHHDQPHQAPAHDDYRRDGRPPWVAPGGHDHDHQGRQQGHPEVQDGRGPGVGVVVLGLAQEGEEACQQQ